MLRKASLASNSLLQKFPFFQNLPSTSPQLIIFDKDGTLIDFSFMWAKWAGTLCNNLSKQVDDDALKLVTNALQFDLNTRAVGRQSPLCCTPMNRIYGICRKALLTRLEKQKADEVMQTCWHTPDPVTDTRPLTDLVSLFSTLRDEMGVKIAVCTTDNRSDTLLTLRKLKVDKFVSAVLCGDDEHVPPKPSPEQIHHICDMLGVDVNRTIMVGDTITDMKMARLAGVSLSVGIPFGAGQTEDLLAHADIVLPSMNNFLKVVSPISTLE